MSRRNRASTAQERHGTKRDENSLRRSASFNASIAAPFGRDLPKSKQSLCTSHCPSPTKNVCAVATVRLYMTWVCWRSTTRSTIPQVPAAERMWSPSRRASAAIQPRSRVKKGCSGVVVIGSPSIVRRDYLKIPPPSPWYDRYTAPKNVLPRPGPSCLGCPGSPGSRRPEPVLPIPPHA